MIDSKWDDKDAEKFIAKYAPKYGEDVALRTYSARLIGTESSLVLHGGGNTSVKSIFINALGEKLPALYVKGSGWDLASIEPAGHPGLDLNYLLKLRSLKALNDEAMVNEFRTHLFDASSPTPSVETLLHAFLPPKFIDHSHADAILTLTNTVNGEEITKECFGSNVVYVPYVMPGFALAKLAADLYDKSLGKIGMVLIRHGLFSFGATARESYENHLKLVNRASEYIADLISKAGRTNTPRSVPAVLAENILPHLRGALALRDEDGKVRKRFILALRSSPEILNFVNSPGLEKISLTPPLTPDHIIRTKEKPLILRSNLDSALADYRSAYDSYFDRCTKARAVTRTKLDNLPRVILVPGLGLVTAADTFAAANIAADIYEHTIKVKSTIERFAEYRGLPEVDLFDCEYWGLEQAKLALQKPKPLHGRVALISGGSGAIGMGIAKVLKDAGAEVVISDIKDVEKTSTALGVFGVISDVSSESSVRACFKNVIQRYGGIDIVIPNAGVALSAPIEEISESDAKRVMDINFHGYLNFIKIASEYLKAQNSAGHIVIISSKNVPAPGKEFAIYSASKAAGHQLGKVAALELAPYGIRVNMITPDAVFDAADKLSGLWQSVGPQRAKARGLELNQLEDFYKERNLLKTKISAEDVGRAVLFFVTEQTPTTGATLPVDGGVAEAFSR